uniref:Polyprotein n=1 Tax=Peronospora matthiolae TaxID=2874970 RepID=A0AAV1U680_9STRA
MAKYETHRVDYLVHAEELAHFAQAIEMEARPGRFFGKEVVAHVDESTPRKETRTCYGCGKMGHVKADCRSRRTSDKNSSRRGKSGGNIVLAIGEGIIKKGKRHAKCNLTLAISNDSDEESDDWILDSGSSRHLVNNASLLQGVRDCEHECHLADGEVIKLSRVGSVVLTVKAEGHERDVTLTEVYLAPDLSRNIMSYGKLERKGFGLVYDGTKRTLARRSNGEVVFDIKMEDNVLYVDTVAPTRAGTPRDVLMAILTQDSTDVSAMDVQIVSLYHFHQRLGHLAYDTVERMASDPESGITLTDRARPTCISCAQGKQTKNAQSRKDTGANSPIDRIGGVICSDLKGPMTPKDRLGNRYLVNFVDHKSNYCRVFLAPTKDKAAKKFEHFLAFFERQFECRIHVLRTDGGAEYANVDLFCKSTGVARQVSKARNQASNGKAERMHRTVLNMARSMSLASRLPVSFWGDEVEYAAYIINRSPTSANAKRASPLEVLTKHAPDLRDIVAFGSVCSVYRDPRKNSLARRSQVGIIIGRSDETKGYRVFLQKENKVTVTQHVKDIETLSEAQNN